MNLAYPFNRLENEEKFYLYENIKVKIVGQNNTEISIEPLFGNILITNYRLCWFNFPKKIEELTIQEKQIVETIQSKHGQKKELWQQLNIQGKSFMFLYPRVISHGLQNNKLKCFLGDEESEDEFFQQDDKQSGLEDLLEQTNPEQIINLEIGKYQIEFDLSNLDKETQEELFENFTNMCLA